MKSENIWLRYFHTSSLFNIQVSWDKLSWGLQNVITLKSYLKLGCQYE